MNFRFGANFAIFIIFFAISLLEAFRDSDYLKAGLWFLAGAAFLAADNLRK